MYLDVEEPLRFYLDLILIGLMCTIAATFAVCILVQHRSAMARALRGARSALFAPRDAETGNDTPTTNGGGHGHSNGHSRAPLTPGTIKSAYRHVVKGFHEMV